MSESSAKPPLPYLKAAVICERVLRENDNVLSAIRIIDRWASSVERVDPDGHVTRVIPVKVTLMVMLISGTAGGAHTLGLALRNPQGNELRERQQFPFELPAQEDFGANLLFDLGFQTEIEGVHWFELTCDDQLLTRVPLGVYFELPKVGG